MAKTFKPYWEKHQRSKIYLACEELDFTWAEKEVKQVTEMWKEGKSIRAISYVLKRDADEVLILIIDLLRAGNIKQRPGGALGVMA